MGKVENCQDLDYNVCRAERVRLGRVLRRFSIFDKETAMRSAMKSGLLPLVLFLGATTAHADDIETIEKSIEKMWSKYNSVSAALSMNMTTPMGAAKSTGKMLFLRQDNKELSRTEMTVEMDMGGQKMTMPQIVINDGEWVYTIVEMMGQKNAQKSKPKGMDASLGGADMFKRLKENHTLKILDSETIDGQDMHVIEAVPNTPVQMGPETFRMYISKKDGVPRKYSGVDSTGKETLTMLISDIKLNEKLDPAQFVPPADVTYTQMPGS